MNISIVVVPRERFSATQRSLEDIYKHTTLPFRLVYVDAGSPPRVRRYLETAAREKDFDLVRVDRFLSPTQARNLALSRVNTKYVVFLDNDVLLTPHWLERLLLCAEETGAWVVGPLYLQGELQEERIHMAGGFMHTREQDGKRTFYDEHLFADSLLSDVGAALERKPCDYVEFHCALVRTDVFTRLGPLDEELLSVHEHLDFAIRVKQAGGSVYFEPNAVISYLQPPPCEWRDLPYFLMRWSEAWNRGTVQHFKAKWGYSTVRSFDDLDGPEPEETILRWARGHRRLLTGLRISGDGDDRPDSPLEEAQCMVALFLSVDRAAFDLVLADKGEHAVEEIRDLEADSLFERLPGLLVRADLDALNLMIRPRPWPAAHPVALLRLDELNAARMERVRPFSFLVLATGPDLYQCWLAVAKGDSRSAALWRRIGVTPRIGGADPVRLSGSRIVGSMASSVDGDAERVLLVEGSPGLVTPLWELEEKGLLPLLRSSLLA